MVCARAYQITRRPASPEPTRFQHRPQSGRRRPCDQVLQRAASPADRATPTASPHTGDGGLALAPRSRAVAVLSPGR